MSTQLPNIGDGAIRILAVLLVVVLAVYFGSPKPKSVTPSGSHGVMETLNLRINTMSGVMFLGDSGSGKTTALIEFLSELLQGDIGAALFSVKEDAAEDARKMLRRAGREYETFRVGESFYNPIAFALHEWGVVECAHHLELTAEVLSGGESGTKEQFWQGMFREGLIHALTLIHVAFDNPTPVHLLDLIGSIPNTPAARLQGEFKDSKAFKIATHAERRATAQQKHDVAAAIQWLFVTLPASGDKVQGAVVSEITNVVSPLCRGAIRSTVHCKRSTILPSDPSNGRVIVWDYPLLVHGRESQILQTLWRIQACRYILKTPPERYTVLVTDECQFLTHLKFDRGYQSSCRSSLGISVMATQHISGLIQAQSDGPMSVHSVNAWLADFPIKCFGSTADPETQEFIVKLVGEGIRMMISGGPSGESPPDTFDPFGIGGRAHVHFSQSFRQKVEKSDITTLRRGSVNEGECVDMICYQNGMNPPHRFVTIRRSHA